MGRHKRERANLGENLEGSELERTNVERPDQSMSGNRTDRSAGSEGIEDPAIERGSREGLDGTEREEKEPAPGGKQRKGKNRQPDRERTEQQETHTSSTDVTE